MTQVRLIRLLGRLKSTGVRRSIDSCNDSVRARAREGRRAAGRATDGSLASPKGRAGTADLSCRAPLFAAASVTKKDGDGGCGSGDMRVERSGAGGGVSLQGSVGGGGQPARAAGPAEGGGKMERLPATYGSAAQASRGAAGAHRGPGAPLGGGLSSAVS